MAYNPDEYSDKIDAILEWADDGRAWFDTLFVEKMAEQLEEYSTLTDAQRVALDNIIDKFHIEV